MNGFEKKVNETQNMSEKDKQKEELRIKKKEAEQKEERLKQIPVELEKYKSFFKDKVKRADIELEMLKPQLKYPKILNPYFEFEKKAEWTEIRKKELQFKIEMKEKEINAIRNEEKNVFKKLSEQESRIKEDLPKLRARIKEIKKTSKINGDKQTKSDYIG